MTGMNRNTGTALGGLDHLVQSIGDILTTPIGTRIMRRDYGSLLFELLDRPLNTATRLLCVVAVAMALGRWEPRLTLRQVFLDGDYAQGELVITVIAQVATLSAPNSLVRLAIPIPLITSGRRNGNIPTATI